VGAIAGCVCGLVAAAPLALLLQGKGDQMGHGIAAVAFAFLLVQGAILAVHAWWPADLLSFGTISVLTFLLVVIVAVARREMRP